MAGVKVIKMPLQLIFRKYHDTYVTTVLLPLLGSGKLILMQCRVNLCFNTQCQNSDFCFQLIRTCNDVLNVTTRKNAGDLSRHLNYQVIIFCPRDQGTSCINSSSKSLTLFKIFSIKNWNLNSVNELGPKQSYCDCNAIQMKDKSHDFFFMQYGLSLFLDVFFDPKYDRCFCTECHAARGDKLYYTRGEPAKDYGIPIGWCRFGLK